MVNWVVRRRCLTECRTYTSNLRLMLVSHDSLNIDDVERCSSSRRDDVLVSWRRRGRADSITHTSSSICVIDDRSDWSRDVVRCEPVD